MDTSNIITERAQRVGEKSNDKERAIVIQFSFCKIKINILGNCKKIKGTKISIFEDFCQEKIRTFSIEVLFARKGGYQYNQLSDFLS